MFLKSLDFSSVSFTFVLYSPKARSDKNSVSDSWLFVLPHNCWDADLF